MMMLLELFVTAAALLLPVVAVVAILTGKRAVGVASLIAGIVAVFLYGFAMGFHSQAREARRRLHDKIEQPLHLIVKHMQELSAHGRTNDLDHVLDVLGETDLCLFPDPNRPQPELMDVFKQLTGEPQRTNANNTSEGIRQPADGLPKPSM